MNRKAFQEVNRSKSHRFRTAQLETKATYLADTGHGNAWHHTERTRVGRFARNQLLRQGNSIGHKPGKTKLVTAGKGTAVKATGIQNKIMK
jgi:hypothetical protein